MGLALATGLKGNGGGDTIVRVTDGLEALVPLMDENIALNAANIPTTTVVLASHLSWGQKFTSSIPKGPDVLLAADCCYLEETFPLLLSTMTELIGGDTVCYFCYKRRRRADNNMMKMVSKIFEVKEVQGRWQTERVFLYEIRRKAR